jgi:hypothetical protein
MISNRVTHDERVEMTGACTLPRALPLIRSQVGFPTLQLRLEQRLPFAFTRFGDVDWIALTSTHRIRKLSFNRSHGIDRVPTYDHCVHQEYSELLAERERGAPSMAQLTVSAGEFFMCQEVHPSLNMGLKRYLNHTPLKRPFDAGGFYFPLTEPAVNVILRARTTVLIGPTHLQGLGCMLGHAAFICVPRYGAFSTSATSCIPGGHGSRVCCLKSKRRASHMPI